VGRTPLKGVLQPRAEALEAVLDAQERAEDPAEDEGGKHDQHRCAVPHRCGPVPVRDARRGGRGDQQRDQPQTVGDDVPRALVEPVADQDADPGAEKHRGHVHDGADAREHRTSWSSGEGTGAVEPGYPQVMFWA
jgi:hypothetical protein